ncbi:MAG: SDR family NAD(P)-dependent oxidoreductase [Bacteroidota bacterium]
MQDRLKIRLKEKYGQWAVISGASSGIGRELTFNVCKAGLNAIIIGRNIEALREVKSKCEDHYKTEVLEVVCDLGRDDYTSIYEACKDKNIGLFIASAGFGTSGPFIENSVQSESDMVQVNCKALMVLTHYFGQHFASQKRGGIILLSSMVGFQGVPFTAHYAATKAYVQSLAEGLYHELKPKGVDVLAAAPGPVETGFAQQANLIMDGAMNVEKIGWEILNALGRKMTVLPGGLTKVLMYALRTTPRWGKIRIMKGVMGGMTKHQRV